MRKTSGQICVLGPYIFCGLLVAYRSAMVVIVAPLTVRLVIGGGGVMIDETCQSVVAVPVLLAHIELSRSSTREIP